MEEINVKKELIKLRSYLMQSEDVKHRMDRIKRARTFCKYLEQNNINYDVCIKHQEVLGCDESREYYKRFDEYLDSDYIICKNLLVHERKGEKRNFLIITDSKKKIDLKSLKETIDSKKLEFVDKDNMKDLLNTEPGNVSLFNIMYDKEKQVNLIIDEDLLTGKSLAFHPLYNGMSVFLKPIECFKFLKLIDRKCCVLPIESKQEIVDPNQNVKCRQLAKVSV